MMKNKQAGNTLIFVLIILLLITIIGTWAIRGAITSLNITTNAQAQALLVQNSDAVFFQLESYADHAVKIAKLQLDNGMIGYVNKPENKGKELVYCLRKSAVCRPARSGYRIFASQNSWIRDRRRFLG